MTRLSDEEWPLTAALANDIRIVDGKHDLGAGALAEALTARGWSRSPSVMDWDEYRRANGWPTPNHMRSTADALDVLTAAKYGEILRWVADACDMAPPALRSQPIQEPRPDLREAAQALIDELSASRPAGYLTPSEDRLRAALATPVPADDRAKRTDTYAHASEWGKHR